jgi:NADH-quinone oxidoreductase F subunit
LSGRIAWISARAGTLPAEQRIVLERAGIIDPLSIEDYIVHDGYQALGKVLTTMKPADVIAELQKSGLRGRGGAGFPTGTKWSFVAKAPGSQKYVVCNADESEPGTFKDRLLIEKTPHQILEGIVIAAWAVQARTAYLYIRGEMREGARILQQAIAEASRRGFLGRNLFGSGFDLEVVLHRGAGAYICGEETALLSSLEGGRGCPRIRPPFPAVEGAFRAPTVVNNVETLCNLPHILTRGAAWYRTIGTEKSPGPKLFPVCGHVAKPGTYELPLGVPLRSLLEEHAGGVWKGRTLKAVIPGGSSVPVLTADEASRVTMDFECCAAAGTMLGSGGVIVMDDTTCMADALLNLARFYHHESCGQCTPCREGCGWIEKILRRIERGDGRPGDLDLCLDVAQNMPGRTICVLADALAIPVRSFIVKFRAEFEAHVRGKRCPFRASAAAAQAAG